MLDITDDDLGNLITAGLRNVAAACLELSYPTIASVPHSLINGYKNVLAIAVETDYSFPLAEKVRGCAGARVRAGMGGSSSRHPPNLPKLLCDAGWNRCPGAEL